MSFNYKKNKLEQLKGFCSVVECGSSINDAAIRDNISATTISKQISSLEEDLGFQLFDRIKNRLVLNKTGKIYYQEAKKILLVLDDLYNGKIGIARVSNQTIYLQLLKNKIKDIVFILKLKIEKKKITFSAKSVILAFFIFFICIIFYMKEKNYDFDKQLFTKANPFLKEVMQKDYYRIDRNVFCSFEPTQFHLDINSLLLRLIEEKYKLHIICITINEHPGTPIRMNGDETIDNVFNNKEAIKCDTERRYISLKTRYTQKMRMMNLNKDTYLYNFYENDNGRNHNIFIDNINKHPKQLFGIKVKLNNLPLNTGKYWIIKYDNYHYLFIESNGIQSQNQDNLQERYLIFKKLTLDELMNYDNGSYWKLIKEYNIKID